MDYLNHPVVKVVLTVLAAANAVVLNYPGLPPVVYTVTSILSAVFVALGYGVTRQANVELRRAKAEVLELKGGRK